jgi:small subunit ribosomal protein S3
VIGKKGEDIENLKAELRKLLGVQMVHVNIEEIRKPEVDAQLIADSITQQLEKRIMFRRAMKRAMQNAMRLGAQGIKIMSAGRLNGIEIARTEWYREGRVPLHTLRADIDYGFSEAKTTYGVIGVKVWVYKGEVSEKPEQPAAPSAPAGDELPVAKKMRKAPPRSEEKPGEEAKVTPESAAEKGPEDPAAKAKSPRPKAPRKAVAAEPVATAPEGGTAGAEAKPKTPVKRVRKAKPETGEGK